MILQDKKLSELLLEKKNIIEAGRKVDKQLQELSNEQQKRVMTIRRIEEKATAIIRKKVYSKLPEFEEIKSFTLNNSGDIEIVITNAIEEFKVNYKKIKEKQEKEKLNKNGLQ